MNKQNANPLELKPVKLFESSIKSDTAVNNRSTSVVDHRGTLVSNILNDNNVGYQPQ